MKTNKHVLHKILGAMSNQLRIAQYWRTRDTTLSQLSFPSQIPNLDISLPRSQRKRYLSLVVRLPPHLRNLLQTFNLYLSDLLPPHTFFTQNQENFHLTLCGDLSGSPEETAVLVNQCLKEWQLKNHTSPLICTLTEITTTQFGFNCEISGNSLFLEFLTFLQTKMFFFFFFWVDFFFSSRVKPLPTVSLIRYFFEELDPTLSNERIKSLEETVLGLMKASSRSFFVNQDFSIQSIELVYLDKVADLWIPIAQFQPNSEPSSTS